MSDQPFYPFVFDRYGRAMLRTRTSTVAWARVVKENEIGRPLRSDEHVHHINRDWTDDRPDNLELLNPSDHAKRHGRDEEREDIAFRMLTELMSERRPMRAVELARRVKARDLVVWTILDRDRRFVQVPSEGGAKFFYFSANCWPREDATRPGRAGIAPTRPGSQNARILAVLDDEHWHTVSQIHSVVGPCRLNSRIAELRKKGNAILCRRIPGKTGAEAYEYRLLPDSDPDRAPLGTVVQFEDASLPPSRVSSPPAPVSPSAGAGLQLTLEGAFA